MGTNFMLNRFKALFSEKNANELNAKWAKLRETPVMQIAALICSILFYMFVFGDFSQATLFVGSMLLHEAGHGIVYMLNGVKFRISITFPFGASSMPINKEEVVKTETLHANKLSWLMHSGNLVNIVLMAIGKAAEMTGLPMISEIGADLAFVNMLLAAVNMLPIWSLDAGQLYHFIFSSLKDRSESNQNEDNHVLAQLLLLAMLMLGIILVASNWQQVLTNVIQNIGWVAFLIIFAMGAMHKSLTDDADYSYTKNALSINQLQLHLVIYILMVITVLGLPNL